MKKCISFCIALMFVLQIGVLNLPVSAANTSSANLEVSTEYVFAGEAVYVTVYLTSNPGLTYVKLKVSYDADVLTLFGVQNGEVISDLTRGSAYVWSAVDSTTTTGVFATLIFSVSETASAGTYPITLTCSEASNHDSDVSVNIQNGSIVVNAEECIHNMETVSHKASTCKVEGSSVMQCTKCDYSETITFDTIDCVAEHEADCTTDAKCKYCGKVLESAYGHKYNVLVIDPTTTTQGYTLHTCMRCDESYQDNILPPVQEHEHTYDVYQIVAASCVNDGYTIYKCSDASCGDTYQTDIVKATGHTYSSTVVQPTCQDNGYTQYTCKTCGDSYKDHYQPKVDHKYENGQCVYCEIAEPTPDYIPGDINGDGVLNNKDVTRLMQYHAGWDVEVDELALDVNGDGSYNNKDVTRLMQYIAGWDVEIH